VGTIAQRGPFYAVGEGLGVPLRGPYYIPSKATTGVRVGFVYAEPERTEPGEFVADIALVDQLGNHHWLRGLRFKRPEKMFS
jgi:hypothetical protein